MAVVDSATAAKIIEDSPSMEPSPSTRVSDAASESSSICATVDPSDQSTSSPNRNRDVEIQSPTSLRSEEYRQLFRLPPEEVLIQDFNCAFQENILLQGHMYVFLRYICFYSNIFGFETKRTIPFHEVTCVRRAKTAGIFPNAIEILAGGKKHFFASFLSRDEAFKIINDGWLQHGNGAKAVTEQQESISESSNQENGLVVFEKVRSFKNPVNELDSVDRNKDAPTLNDSNLPPKVEDNIMSTTVSELQENIEEEAEPILNSDSSSSGKTLTWKQENSDAPKIPEYYTKVAEIKFPIKVEEFFSFFFSDDAVNFVESFHRSSGDKDFRCTSWYPHDKFGHARDVSFQHPIKLYFGAKFGSCQEVQKFRVYRNSHLVVETSQEINDVPYGDYFRVEGLWDVERDGDESKECCILRVYVNVAFSKKTVWKGKIVQSTLEECREAYASWINIAHELLKQKNLEKRGEGDPDAGMIQNDRVHFERHVENGEPSERSHEANDPIRIPQMSDSRDDQQVGKHLQGNLIYTTSIVSLFKESMVKFYASLKSQSYLPLLLVITFAVILLLMQLSIVVLLSRPQQVHVISQADYMNVMGSGAAERSSEALAWLEKQIHHLKDEMLMVEYRIEKMRHEHTLLKAQLENLEHFKKRIVQPNA
ncbi:hypothetical protein L1049_017969 [Liquidambar formosana]|uniref:VASt domain-containing protein n=1 Tax=Liquidambar formosana TaxID=63359 RepID=A0AAP0R7L6_LIQFO